MEKKRKRFLYFIPFIFIAVLALVSGVVMLLWNGVVTEVLNLKQITYWQALGLLIISKILFGSFRPGPPGGFRRGQHWRRKLMDMSPEERDHFKKEWQQRRGEEADPMSGPLTGGAI
jgi:Ca2+/H+ antiporter, TMEM165/GDT1 family